MTLTIDAMDEPDAQIVLRRHSEAHGTEMIHGSPMPIPPASDGALSLQPRSIQGFSGMILRFTIRARFDGIPRLTTA